MNECTYGSNGESQHSLWWVLYKDRHVPIGDFKASFILGTGNTVEVGYEYLQYERCMKKTMLLALQMSCEILYRCWRNTYFLRVDQCPDKLGIIKHVLCPLLTVVIALESLKVLPRLKELFKHGVSSTFEGAAPFVETLCDLGASSVGGSSQRKTPHMCTKTESPVITVQDTSGYMASQMVCRTGIATLSGISQGLACIPTHCSYVGMKNPTEPIVDVGSKWKLVVRLLVCVCAR
jgi:hypothetical protein